VILGATPRMAGWIPWQTDRPALSPGTLAQHHAILRGALKAAVLEGLVVRIAASLGVSVTSFGASVG
jgi:hypothetical protein